MRHFLFTQISIPESTTPRVFQLPPQWRALRHVLVHNNQGVKSECYLVGKCLSMEVNSVHVYFVAHSQ